MMMMMMISLKVNILAQMEIELAFFEAAIQHLSHDTTETPGWIVLTLAVQIFFFLARGLIVKGE